MKASDKQPGANFLASAGKLFRYYKKLGEGAMDQLSADELQYRPSEESNSVAIIVKHLHGNMLSRWTNFLEEDGEKAWRDREGEFDATLNTAEAVRHAWEEGWACLFDNLDPLTADDVDRMVYIRNEGHTVLEAINRQLAHYAYHVGQIVVLAKQIRGKDFASLSIPRGGSQTYNKKKFDQDKGRRHFV